MRHIAVNHMTEFHSRVLVGFVPSDIGAVDFLPQYSDDADEKDKVHLWRQLVGKKRKKEIAFIVFHTPVVVRLQQI